MVDHRAEHASDFLAASDELLVFLCGDVTAVMSKVERGVRFIYFRVAVGKFADKMR